MRKRLSILITLGVVFLLGVAGAAYGNMAIHGCYLMDTDACAGCHRAHTSASPITWVDTFGNYKSALLIGNAETIAEFCLTCHGTGAPGAATNVIDGVLENSPGNYVGVGEALNGGGFELIGATQTVTSAHLYDGTRGIAWGGGVNGYTTSNIGGFDMALDCASCHDPHGSSNYRILNDTVNGIAVGGYDSAAGPPWDVINPKPTPFVLSMEPGYPREENGYRYMGAPYNGFLLHTSYPDYIPYYTRPMYSTPPDGPDAEKGMTGWCIACHSQYATTEGNSAVPTTVPATTLGKRGVGNTTLTSDADPGQTIITVGSNDAWRDTNGNLLAHNPTVQIGSVSLNPTTFETRRVIELIGSNQLRLDTGLSNSHSAGDPVYAPYAAADMDGRAAVRHRHAMNVPLAFFHGDRPINISTTLPLAQTWDTSQTVDLEDWMECLTCHKAHGTAATMTGYANTNWTTYNGQPMPGEPNSGSGGVAPANSSALLRMDNRGVCQDCHNK